MDLKRLKDFKDEVLTYLIEYANVSGNLDNFDEVSRLFLEHFPELKQSTSGLLD